jgi:hypothetical protein
MTLSAFSWWLRRDVRFLGSRPGRPHAAHLRAARPGFETLEDRTVPSVPSIRFVVSPEVPADYHTTFYNISQALFQPGSPDPGDIVQIEPGAFPGVLPPLPLVDHLTIQGEPNAGPDNLRPLVIDDPNFTVQGVNRGLVLRGLHIVLDKGELTFQTDGSLVNCLIEQINGGSTGVRLDLTTMAVVQGNRFVSRPSFFGGADGMLQVNPGAHSSNIVSGNTFWNLDSALGMPLLNYNGMNGTFDKVTDNVFIGNGHFIDVRGELDGLTVERNTLTGPSNLFQAIGIYVFAAPQHLNILDNRINLLTTGSIAIQVNAELGFTTDMVIADNQIATGGTGIGIDFEGGASAPMQAKVEGNDLHNNKIGVKLNSGTTVDLGGGALGSRGDNNFRGFTAPAISTAGAIVVQPGNNAGPFFKAHNNIFSVPNPEAVILDANDVLNTADVDPTNNLTGNAAFVEALYLKFLHRIGDLNNPADAGTWVTALNNGMPASAVAGAIVRSPEALGLVVDGLYHKFLNRDADANGRAGFVSELVGGVTLENVIVQFVTSPEYASRFSSDFTFIYSLYVNLLDRNPGPGEVNTHLATLAAGGRAAVANNFVSSAEFRGDVVRIDYRTILGRANDPTNAELAGWVNSQMDLLSIEVVFASSVEFQANG